MLEPIKLPALKKILKELEADTSTQQLVINTALLYNSLVQRFNTGENVHPYMLTGTNGQVFNQLLALKKLKLKDKKDDEPDSLTEFLTGLKSKSN